MSVETSERAERRGKASGATNASYKDDGRPHSDVPGVSWYLNRKKWIGTVKEKLKRTTSGGRTLRSTAGYEGHDACVAALKVLRAEVDAMYATATAGWADEDPLTRGLALGPTDAADAEAKTVYWRPNHMKGHRPRRVVSRSHGKQGYQWRSACDLCEMPADASVKEVSFCHAHMPAEHRSAGGGKKCLDVTKNPNAGKLMCICARCESTLLTAKRQKSKGGIGICASCEATVRVEAAEVGAEPPAASQRWEDLVLDRLIPLVGEDPEMRDDHRSMLGELRKRAGHLTRKRRHGETACDTEHRRRPDLLYVLRHSVTARLVACISVEVDEYSHFDRDTACELAKVDDTRHALQTLGQREGFGPDAGHCRPDIAAPFYYVFKMNPNACDGGAIIRLDERIAVLAARVRAVFALDREDLLARALEGESVKPIVECLFHHRQKAAHHLAAFEEQGRSGNWNYMGNATC